MIDSGLTRRELLPALRTVGALALVSASAQHASAQQTDTVKSKQGSWFAEYLMIDGHGFKAFLTFTANGGLIATGQGDLRHDAPASAGHGSWAQQGHHADIKVLRFIFDITGAPAATVEEFLSGDLDDSGDLFSATTTVNTYDLNGHLMSTIAGTMHSRRIGLAPIFGG